MFSVFRRLIASLLLCLSAAMSAQQDLSIQGDGRKEIKIAVAAFSGQDLSPLQESLTSSFPLRLREALSVVSWRSLSELEVAAYRRWSREKAILDEARSMEEANVALGKAVFSLAPSSSALSENQKRLENSRERIASMESFSAEKIDVSLERPIVWKDQGNQQLLPPLAGDPQIAAARQDLDLLLYGTLIGFEEYLAVDIVLYARFPARPLLVWRTSFAEDDSTAALDEVITALSETLAGRPVAGLRISVQPDNADIWLDGAYAGRGDSLLTGLASGPRMLEFRAEGHTSIRMPISLEPSTLSELSVDLERDGTGMISVEVLAPGQEADGTTAQGAAIYLDATRIGLSPLELPATGATHVLSVRSELGARAQAVTSFDPGLKVLLEPRMPSKEEGFISRRDAFYLSLGWFMASLPLAVLGNGLYSIHANQIANNPSLGVPDGVPLLALQIGAYSSAGLSAGLLGVSVWRFVQYLSSTHRR